VTTPPELAQAYTIRSMVFVDEQGVPPDLERDDRDADADHFLARLDGTAVGAARLVVEPAGYEGLDRNLGAVAHLGRLAVLAGARRTGLGVLLARSVEERAAELGLQVVYLGAQSHAVGFYQRLGYATFGAEFDDAGLPHRHMARQF
jgi:predicted GNAT family N-acyltransferase